MSHSISVHPVFFLTLRMTYSKTTLEVMAVKHLTFQTTVNRVKYKTSVCLLRH